jgi:hypothetical protein
VLVTAGIVAFALFPAVYSEGDSALFDRLIIKNNGAVWQEPELLDFFLKVKLYEVLQPLLTLPTQAFQIMSVVAGGIYLAGACLLARTMGRNRLEGMLFIGSLIFIGDILFYFRYIENYALVLAASLFVLWGCWRYMESRLSFSTLCLVAGVTALIHGEGFWWAPMILAAWFIRAYRRRGAQRWRIAGLELGRGLLTAVAVLVLVVSVVILDGYSFTRLNVKVLQPGVGIVGGNDTHLFVPLSSTSTVAENYTYFSLSHLGAVVQEQMLTAPMALATILIVLILSWGQVRALLRTTPALLTLSVGAISVLLYTVSWNPDLGPRNDWDLLALSAVPLSLLAIYLLLRLPAHRAKRLALAVYLSVSAVHTTGWVLLHTLNIR